MDINYIGTTGGIKVCVGSELIGWIVKTPTAYEFIHVKSLEKSINRKLRELNES